MLDTKSEQKWPLTGAVNQSRVISFVRRGGGFFAAAGSVGGRKMSGPNRPPNSTIISDLTLACQCDFGIMPQICVFNKFDLFTLYNFPYCKIRNVVLSYSHKRWYPIRGKLLKAQQLNSSEPGQYKRQSKQKRNRWTTKSFLEYPEGYSRRF